MNTGLFGGIVFVLVFTGMVLVHELGHFLAARLLKIDIEEFGIGFPPRLLRFWRSKGWLVIGNRRVVIPPNTDLPFDSLQAPGRVAEAEATDTGKTLLLRSIKLAATEDGVADSAPYVREQADRTVILHGTIKEIHEGTQWTINWLPLGGFVRPKGEDDPSIRGGLAAAAPWKRLIVLLAGVTMNLLTAVVAYAILFSNVGAPQFNKVAIMGLEPGGPAEQAGLQVGDVILSVAGQKVTSTTQLITITHQHLGQPVEVVFERAGEQQSITVTPRTQWPENSGPMGVIIGIPSIQPKSWVAALPFSFQAVAKDMSNLLSLPGRWISGQARPEEVQIGGPRSIWNLFQAAVASDLQSRQVQDESTQPTYYTLAAIIALSVSLGTFNLLPIPALDGGRIFFLLPELLFRRPLPARFQMTANGIAFILLVTLLIFFYVRDFINPMTFNLP
jgi:regulator of sigma E protease